MNNKSDYGSQPIKNEQSGSAQTWSLIASKVINSINVPNVDKDPNGAIEAMESLHRMNELISVISNIELSITRILTAAKVSTVDEVVQMLERQPLSDEDIERAASKYAFENNTHRSNSKAFIAGANFAKQTHSKEWVSVSERLPEEHHNVLLYNGYGVIMFGFYNGDDFYETYNGLTSLVTHWMSLPHPHKNNI